MIATLRILAVGVAMGVSPAEQPDAGKTATRCPSHVDSLPASSLYDPDDPRLRATNTIVLDKSARALMLYRRGRLQGCWRVGLGFSPIGHKAVEGDGKTPEGWYRTSDKPWSSFEGAIAVHYPNPADARAGLAAGRIGPATRDRIVTAGKAGRLPPQRTPLGGAILIHGGGSMLDWTLGCIAVTDEHLQELRDALPSSKQAHLLVLP